MRRHLCLLFGVGLFLATSTPTPAAAEQLKVITLNIFGEPATATGTNGWNQSAAPGPRKNRVINQFLTQSAHGAAGPDVIAVSEALVNQVNDLKAGLTGFTGVGVGSDDGVNAGEFEMVFWRTNKYTATGSGTFWLSPTPDTPGSAFPGRESVKRSVTWAKLRDNATLTEFVAMSTHWDFLTGTSGDNIRQQSGQIIRNKMASIANGLPVVVMGDFNNQEGTVGYNTLTSASPSTTTQLFDAYRTTHPTQNNQTESTAHFGFTGSKVGLPIDFVFHTNHFTTDSATIENTYTESGLYPSDHYAVSATLTFVPEPGIIAATAIAAGFTLIRRRRPRH